MKRILCGALLIGFVTRMLAQGVSTNVPPVAPGEVSPPRESAQDAVSKSDNVNVRAQASTIGEIVTRLKKGEPVVILEEIAVKKPKKDEPSRWARIAFPLNTPVWINAAFVDATNGTVKVKKLNVRAGPGENYSVIGRLAKDDAVKEIRRKEGWMEIQAPTNAFAFVALELLTKVGTTTNASMAETAAPTVAPAAPAAPPPLEVVTNTAETKTAVPVEPEKATTIAPVKPEPTAPAIPTPAPPVVTETVTNAPPTQVVTNVAPVEAPAAERPVLAQKRVVAREGTVRRAYSLAAPTGFALENAETGLMMDYLYPANARIQLKQFLGYRVIVTGQEGVDKRWPATPVLMVETVEFP